MLAAIGCFILSCGAASLVVAALAVVNVFAVGFACAACIFVVPFSLVHGGCACNPRFAAAAGARLDIRPCPAVATAAAVRGGAFGVPIDALIWHATCACIPQTGMAGHAEVRVLGVTSIAANADSATVAVALPTKKMLQALAAVANITACQRRE